MALHVPGSVTDHFTAAAGFPQGLAAYGKAQFIRHAADGQLGMVQNAALRVEEADVARIVHLEGAHQFGEGIALDIHAHDADERARLINGH